MTPDFLLPPDDGIEDDPFQARVCQNCCYFFHHFEDDDSMGICSKETVFFTSWDDENQMENIDFSSCYDLYVQNQFDGEREACEAFENAMIEDGDDMDLEAHMKLETLQEIDTTPLFKNLEQSDRESAKYTLQKIGFLANRGHLDALEKLIHFYQEMGPVTSLEEAAFRIEYVRILSNLPYTREVVDTYIMELARTPSNNITRRLYTKILEELGRYPKSEIRAPIENLLHEKKFSAKIKRRIKEVAGLIESRDEDWDWPFFMP